MEVKGVLLLLLVTRGLALPASDDSALQPQDQGVQNNRQPRPLPFLIFNNGQTTTTTSTTAQPHTTPSTTHPTTTEPNTTTVQPQPGEPLRLREGFPFFHGPASIPSSLVNVDRSTVDETAVDPARQMPLLPNGPKPSLPNILRTFLPPLPALPQIPALPDKPALPTNGNGILNLNDLNGIYVFNPFTGFVPVALPQQRRESTNEPTSVDHQTLDTWQNIIYNSFLQSNYEGKRMRTGLGDASFKPYQSYYNAPFPQQYFSPANYYGSSLRQDQVIPPGPTLIFVPYQPSQTGPDGLSASEETDGVSVSEETDGVSASEETGGVSASEETHGVPASEATGMPAPIVLGMAADSSGAVMPDSEAAGFTEPQGEAEETTTAEISVAQQDESAAFSRQNSKFQSRFVPSSNYQEQSDFLYPSSRMTPDDYAPSRQWRQQQAYHMQKTGQHRW